MPRDVKIEAAALNPSRFSHVIVKVPIAIEDGWGYDAGASPPPKQAFQT